MKREPSGEEWSVLDCAKRLGWTKRDMHKELRKLHRKHGRLLFQETTAKNSKIWVDSARLAKLWPHRFGPKAPTAADIATLRGRVEKAEETAERALLEVEGLRREVEGRRGRFRR